MELEVLLDEYEEKKIAHERQKREAFKTLQSQHLEAKKQVQENAMKELEVLRTVLTKSSSQSNNRDVRLQTRRT